jgi:hypothetical protein
MDDLARDAELRAARLTVLRFGEVELRRGVEEVARPVD